ncbi:PspC domain-containing protein [Paenimyroides aestuarii]|uniref:PspC domain-containing protein n=1 Tax=Paenimyroides aestuarii TaxID=2968490 RepID=A0ABY5NSN7_9FLAO|nr:PspC domain-containing protein [Paenimyroides aestuarii]UUV21499.1 PspC domain-containing protein [Paenimyroides aestuarii]
MNKTVTINIAGLVFHIDEDAYNKLDTYINAVRNSIQQESEEEIISDIESRIAELFAERIDPKTGVIRMNNVDEIIDIMGKPEDYIIEDDEPIRSNHFKTTSKTYRKIYRDGEKRILGGVCSGLGHYFNIDPVWVRILFILLFFAYGLSCVIYLILWVIIPKAVTVADILEMKGEPVNISNIEKQFRDGVNNSYQKIRATGSSAASVLKRIVGIALIVISVMGLFGSFFVPIAFSSDKINLANEFVSYNEVEIGIPFWGIGLSLFIMCAVPFIVLLLLGIKLLNSKLKHIGWVSAILGFIWLVSIFIFSYVMINLDIQKDKIESLLEDHFEQKISKTDLLLSDNDTLNIIFQKDERIFTINDTITSAYKYSEVDDVRIEVLESSTGNSYLEIDEKIFNSKHLNLKKLGKFNIEIESSKFSNTLNYNYSIKSDTLVLSNAILTTLNDFTEDSKVRIKLYITPNHTLKINGNDDHYFWNLRVEKGRNYYKFNKEGELEHTNNIIN